MTTNSDSFTAIDQTWANVQEAFPDAYLSATDEEKPKVQGVRDMTRSAWYAALNKIFHDGDPLVAQLTSDLVAENEQMQSDLDGLRKAAEFLDIAKSAAKTAAALAILAV